MVDSSRGRQRRNALRILFEMDINRTGLEEVIRNKKLVGEVEPTEFTLQLVEGVTEHKAALDRMISRYAEGWDVERMPRVDRNILRIALFELFYVEDIPTGVTIDEAVDIAKEFSTEDSGKFINGVLGRVNRDRETGDVEMT
jgi:transcription antitermination protein NusB